MSLSCVIACSWASSSPLRPAMATSRILDVRCSRLLIVPVCCPFFEAPDRKRLSLFFSLSPVGSCSETDLLREKRFLIQPLTLDCGDVGLSLSEPCTWSTSDPYVWTWSGLAEIFVSTVGTTTVAEISRLSWASLKFSLSLPAVACSSKPSPVPTPLAPESCFSFCPSSRV